MENYASEPFQFQIGDKAFTLKPLGIRSLLQMRISLEGSPEEQVAAIEDMIRKASDKRTADAVMELTQASIQKLLKDWTGMAPGELRTSGDE